MQKESLSKDQWKIINQTNIRDETKRDIESAHGNLETPFKLD